MPWAIMNRFLKSPCLFSKKPWLMGAKSKKLFVTLPFLLIKAEPILKGDIKKINNIKEIQLP